MTTNSTERMSCFLSGSLSTRLAKNSIAPPRKIEIFQNTETFSLGRLLTVSLVILFSTIARAQSTEIFSIDNRGSHPRGNLVLGNDGSFYGTTQFGGVCGFGTIYKITASGVLTTLLSFNGINGAFPVSALALGSDGNFYGTTTSRTGGGGTVFKMTSSGSLTTIFLFDAYSGENSPGELIQGSDGNFYGTTVFYDTSFGFGRAFKITPSGALTTLVAFDGENCRGTEAGLIEGSDGYFYGTTPAGGVNGFGTVFKIAPNGALTTLVSFDGENGSHPHTGLIQGSDGDFYGTTRGLGAAGTGTVFKITASGVMTKLVTFDGNNGSAPMGKLFEARDGNFYGTTTGKGSYRGTVFKMTPEGVLTTLAAAWELGGSLPMAGLINGHDGDFYGSTWGYTAAADGGTIFKISPTGIVTTLVSFPPPYGDGDGNVAKAVQGSDGNFYGTTSHGGADVRGSVFKMSPDGVLTTLVSFDYYTIGAHPWGGLVEGVDGDFYGTTQGGGGTGGTIFKITKSGVLTTLYSFSGPDGAAPRSGLLQDTGGNFYGTTSEAEGTNTGTVFRMTPLGDLTTLVYFNHENGSTPEGDLIKGSDGNFYGTTRSGGSHDLGTAFKMTPDGVITTLVSFEVPQGGRPRAGLIQARDGAFYGTTSDTAFKITPSGEFQTLIIFDETTGGSPSGLVEGEDGNFYGATRYGPSLLFGTIFRLTPSGILTTLYSFDGVTSGFPRTTPFFSDGYLYGTASLNTFWRLSLDVSRPDIEVGRSLSSLSGGGVYSNSSQQILTLSSVKARSVSGYANITNRGDLTEVLRVNAGKGTNLFRSEWTSSTGNITAAITAGSYRTPAIGGGTDSVALRATITPNKRNLTRRKGNRVVIRRKTHALPIRVSSTSDPTLQDAAEIRVETR